MIHIVNKADCCGCTACASICPRDAITMQPDALGFRYPEVNKEKCIECNLCVKVCSFHSNYDKSLNLSKPLAFGARHINLKEVETSRSGAAFIAISDAILEQGGIVYGVGYTNHLHVCHKRATTKIERDEFKGSKYVQSDLGTTFVQVKKDLQKGKLVLFTGTPCQTSGLNNFIGKKLRTNLVLVDIVCHGVPSPAIWEDYVHFCEHKFKEKIKTFNFRDKLEYGWSAHKETLILENGEKVKIQHSLFTSLFHQTLTIRPSCGNCHFCNTQRPSDITIADFWGWEKVNAEINKDNKGISLLLINTTKGLNLFNLIKASLVFFNTELDNCLQYNLMHPTKLNPNNTAFQLDYTRKGLKFILRKYTLFGYKNRLLSILRRLKTKLFS